MLSDLRMRLWLSCYAAGFQFGVGVLVDRSGLLSWITGALAGGVCIFTYLSLVGFPESIDQPEDVKTEIRAMLIALSVGSLFYLTSDFHVNPLWASLFA